MGKVERNMRAGERREWEIEKGEVERERGCRIENGSGERV